MLSGLDQMAMGDSAEMTRWTDGGGAMRRPLECAGGHRSRPAMIVVGSTILFALLAVGCGRWQKAPVAGRDPGTAPRALGDLAALHIRLRDVLAETKGVFRIDYEGEEVDYAEGLLGEGAAARDRKVRAAAAAACLP